MVKCEYQEVTKVVTEVVSKRVICDNCKMDCNHNNYYHLVTQHSDWGRDSIDSIKSFDLCCTGCLSVKFLEYLNQSNNENNSMEFNVEHMCSI